MSALPTPAPTPTPVAPSTDWVPIDVAAERLGKSPGHLRRECTKLEAFNMAAKFIAADGVEKWHIHKRHHAALHAGTLGKAHRIPDLSQYTSKQRRDAMMRVACVKAFREARATWPGNQKDWRPSLSISCLPLA